MDLVQQETNRHTWSRASARRSLDAVTGFIDPGESAAYFDLYGEAVGAPVLDIGVGTGRTVPLLSAMTPEYRGMDCLPSMVRLCRKRYPHLRFDVGDACTLSGYATGYFGLVCFSYNGIDAMSHGDRQRVLRAVRRVLAPRGLFFFSTLNLDGPTYRERPWRPRVWSTKNPVKYALRVATQLVMSPMDMLGWLCLRNFESRGDGYAVAPLSAHHYGLLAHYTTVERQRAELSAEGFASGALFYESRVGQRVEPGDDTSRSDWFHVVARAP